MANEALKETIGTNVRRFRHSKGLSQAKLAEMVDRDASTITNIEGGKRLIGVDLLFRLSAIFSVSVDTLLLPEGKASPLNSINSMLNDQSDEALAHLEPIIRAWLFEYGDPEPSEKKRNRLEKEREGRISDDAGRRCIFRVFLPVTFSKTCWICIPFFKELG